MNRFFKKASVLFLIIWLVAVGPQDLQANNNFNGYTSAAIELSGTPPFTVLKAEGGYDFHLDEDNQMLIFPTQGPAYADSEKTILSCGQKVLVKDANDKETVLIGHYDGGWVSFSGKDQDGNDITADEICKGKILPQNGRLITDDYLCIGTFTSGHCYCSDAECLNCVEKCDDYKENSYFGNTCEGSYRGNSALFTHPVYPSCCGYVEGSGCTNGSCPLFFGTGFFAIFERTCQGPDFVTTIPGDTDLGNSCPATDKTLNPISVFNGNNYESATDITFPTPNHNGLTFSRYYNSQSDDDISLGPGQTHTYSTKLVSDFQFEGATYLQLVDATGQGHYFYSDGSGRYNGVFKERTHVELSGNTYIWYRSDNSKYVFDNAGRLIRTEDALGNRLNLTYESGLLQTVNDEASGRTLTFHYTDSKLSYITGPVTQAVTDGIWANYDYDENGNLETVTYPDGSGFTYVYDDPNDPHNMTEKSNLAGHLISTWDYDENDRVIQNDNRYGKGGTIEYVSHNEVKVTDAYGKIRTYTITTIDGRKRVGAIEGAEGCQSCGSDAARYEYDSKLNITEKEYANGRIDRFRDHTAKGRPRTVIKAYGTEDERTVYHTYHPTLNTPLTRTETGLIQGDKVTVRDYDDPDASGDTDEPNEDPTLLVHRKIEKGHTRDIDGNPVSYEYVTVYKYYPNGQLKSTDGPKAGDADKISYTYHPTGDLYQVTQPLIGSTTYDNYDEAGNAGTVTDVNGIATVYTYDGRNRVLTTTRNGIINERTYDTAGNLETSAVGGIVTTYEYYDDPAEPLKFGRLHKTVNASGDYVCHDYDSNGNRIEKSYYAKNEDGTYTRKKYQGFEYYDATGTSPGKLWKAVNPDDTATVYEYDKMGNIERVTDAENKATAYTYDLFNRTETVKQAAHLSDPAVTILDYDSHGNLKSVTDAESNETVYHFDDLGRRVKRESPDTGVTVYEYDSSGNTVTTKDANDVTVDYVYDALNRLTHINHPDSSLNIVYTYDLGVMPKEKLVWSHFPGEV